MTEESKNLQLGVIGYYPKSQFKCEMCLENKWREESLNWRGYAWSILPKEMRRTLRICVKCAQREMGSKQKFRVKEMIQEFKDGKRINDM